MGGSSSCAESGAHSPLVESALVLCAASPHHILLPRLSAARISRFPTSHPASLACSKDKPLSHITFFCFACLHPVCSKDKPEDLGFPPVEPAAAKPADGKADKAKPNVLKQLVNNVLKNPFIWGMALTYFFIYIVRQVRWGHRGEGSRGREGVWLWLLTDTGTASASCVCWGVWLWQQHVCIVRVKKQAARWSMHVQRHVRRAFCLACCPAVYVALTL